MANPAHVLVVDDDGHIREVMRFALEKAGYRVSEAPDGSRAFELLKHGAFDLVAAPRECALHLGDEDTEVGVGRAGVHLRDEEDAHQWGR